MLSTIKLITNYFDNRLIILSHFLRKSVQILRFSEYFLVSLVLYDSKLHIFGLWTQQDI